MSNVKNLIFIVAYNHEKLLAKTVARLHSSILCNPENEVLIIDDCSSDNTFFVAQTIKQQLTQDILEETGKHCKFTVLKNPINQGYGGNQKLGYRYAIDNGYTHVFLIHGDGQYAPEFLTRVISGYKVNALTGLSPDAVFGTRMHSWKSALKGGMPIYKLLGNIILTFLQNKLLGAKLSEFHSGYRSYSTALLKKIPFERNSPDFHFDTEIIIQILALGGVIDEFAIPTHYGDEVCHVNGFRYAYDVLKSSLHFRLQKLGFLYDRKFDIGLYNYKEKSSHYSSHSMLIRSIDSHKSVLDIGCGNGGIARILQNKKGCETYGVDILPLSIGDVFKEYWSIDLNQNMHQLRIPLQERHYDYIVLADILEHVVDPEQFLEFIRKHHSSTNERSTRLHATTGNVAFFIVRFMLFLGQFNYGPRGILDRTHTRLFTRKSFIHIFNQCGYRVSKVTPIPLPFTSILSPQNKLAQFLEKMNYHLCKIAPGLFAYQFLVEVEVLPTSEQLLLNSKDFTVSLIKSRETSVNLEVSQ